MEKKPVRKICQYRKCKKRFDDTHPLKKYCGGDCCRRAAYEKGQARGRAPADVLVGECVICGKGFTTNRPSKTTCDLQCSAERNRRTARERERKKWRKNGSS